MFLCQEPTILVRNRLLVRLMVLLHYLIVTLFLDQLIEILMVLLGHIVGVFVMHAANKIYKHLSNFRKKDIKHENSNKNKCYADVSK